MTLSRREFLKSSAAASAAAAIGMSVPTSVQAKANEAEGGWRWDKAACRFCGTGCGIMLATKSGKIVELAVRKVIHGETINNKEAIANPEALKYFENIPQLK